MNHECLVKIVTSRFEQNAFFFFLHGSFDVPLIFGTAMLIFTGDLIETGKLLNTECR